MNHQHHEAERKWNWIACLGIAILAFLLRLLYVFEIRTIGFFDIPLSDALVYDQRARGIVAGDWLGPADFIHAPLYPYVLALVRMFSFDSLLAPRIVQSALGAGTCVLVMLFTRRMLHASPHASTIALSAGLLMAVYPPMIFFDGLIQKTSLVLFLSALVLALTAVGCDRQRATWWLWVGVAMGLLILVRQNALALVPLIAAWAWFGSTPSPKPVKRKLTAIAAISLGIAIVLTPWAVRHKIVIGDFFLSTPNMGQNFAMGNHPEATGTYLPAQRGRASGEHEHAVWQREAEQALGRDLTAAEISDFYMQRSLDYIKANPMQWLGLTVKKCIMVFGAYELPDTEDYYLYKEHSRILRIGDALFHFGVLGPLAVAGMLLTVRRWRTLWPLYGWLAINTLAIAAFVVFARYRAPMLPVLGMFAAVAIVQGVVYVRHQNWRPLAFPMAGLIIGGIVMNWPLHSSRTTHAFSYTNHAVALAEAGRFDEALIELDQSHQRAPGDVDAHWVRGSVYFDLQQFDEALVQYNAALDGDPEFGGAYRGIGAVMLSVGRVNEAADAFATALELDPYDAVSLNKLGVTFAMRGDPERGRELIERSIAINPQDAEAHLNLGSVYVALQQLDAAAAAYREALSVKPDYVDALMNLASVELGRHDVDAAARYLQRALDLEPRNSQILMQLVNTLVQAQRLDEAIAHLTQRIAQQPDDEVSRRLLEALRREH